MVEYTTVKRISMILHYICAGLLIAMSLGTWAYKKGTKVEIILACYYILFAVIIIFTELEWKVPLFKTLISYIAYMRYNFGKFGNLMLVFFLGLGKYVFNIIPIVVCICVSIYFLVIAFVFKSDEESDMQKEGESQPKSSAPLSDAVHTPEVKEGSQNNVADVKVENRA